MSFYSTLNSKINILFSGTSKNFLITIVVQNDFIFYSYSSKNALYLLDHTFKSPDKGEINYATDTEEYKKENAESTDIRLLWINGWRAKSGTRNAYTTFFAGNGHIGTQRDVMANGVDHVMNRLMSSISAPLIKAPTPTWTWPWEYQAAYPSQCPHIRCKKYNVPKKGERKSPMVRKQQSHALAEK